MLLNGSLAQQRRERQFLIEAAWVTAKLTRAKRIPSLKRLLRRRRGRRAGHDDLVRMREQQRRLSSQTTLPANWSRASAADVAAFAEARKANGRRRGARRRKRRAGAEGGDS